VSSRLAGECRNAQDSLQTMQPIAIRMRASRRRLVAEDENDLHSALAAADLEADESGKMAIVDFQAANGNTLSFIVGGAQTALSFRYPDDVEPRYLSRGPDPSTEPGFVFSRDGENEIACPRWAIIPRSTGMTALDEFAASNDLPHAVEWAPY
jgi:hypothetical protein